MLANKIIKMLLVQTNTKQTEMSEKLGIERITFTKRMTQKNMSVLILNEMLDILGYKLVAVPKDKQLLDQEYLVEAEKETKK